MTYGKFASAEELLKGYNELEKSFTQKCQQLAALKAVVFAEKDDARGFLATNSAQNTPLAATPTAAVSAEVTAGKALSATVTTEEEHGETKGATAESAALATENRNETIVATESNNAADTESAALSQNSSNNAQTVSENTSEEKLASAEQLRSIGNVSLSEGVHACDTKAPKTLASAREAVTKLLENNTAESPDGTSVETPPSLAEQSTTVDSADTVPQSRIDAPVLDGHATAFSPTESQLQQYLLNNPQIAWQLLQQTSQPPQIMTGGGDVSLALPSRPKTIKEASMMAKQLFKN